MIAGLCESPLTFQAIVIWRDGLNDGSIFLRDITDVDPPYAGFMESTYSLLSYHGRKAVAREESTTTLAPTGVR